MSPRSAACYNRLKEERRLTILEFFETVEKRASYRNTFAAQEIPEADIRKIVTAGLHAPSGYNYQTTSFVVVRDPELRGKLAELLPTPATKTAPVILVAVSEQKINRAQPVLHSTHRITQQLWRISCSQSLPWAMPGSGWTVCHV